MAAIILGITGTFLKKRFDLFGFLKYENREVFGG